MIITIQRYKSVMQKSDYCKIMRIWNFQFYDQKVWCKLMINTRKKKKLGKVLRYKTYDKRFVENKKSMK